MYSEIRNQVVAAASVAKVAGFNHTHEALIELLKEIKRAEADATSLFEVVTLETKA